MTTDNTSRNTPDRRDVPLVGLATFACQPACSTAPMSHSSVYRSTWHRAIASARDSDRGQSARFPCSTASGRRAFDFEDEFIYLTADEMKIVDAGDSDVIYADTKRRYGISTLSWIERGRNGEPGSPSALPLSVAFRIDGR